MEGLISVIIPVYNTEQYVERCIASIQENTYTNLEIICVNDGSTDHSLERLNELAANDSRIKVIDKPNAGVSTARNAGLDAAKGEYIAFVDSDDWVHREHFYVLYENIKDADLVVGYCQENSDGDASEKDSSMLEEIDVRNISVDEAVNDGFIRCSPCGRIYRKSFIGKRRFQSGLQYGEDAVFNVALMSQKSNVKIRRVDAVLYFYFVRPGSLSHAVSAERLRMAAESYLYYIPSLYRKDLCLFQAFRMALLYRYQGMLTDDRRAVRKKANELLRKCRKELKQDSGISKKKKLELFIASYSATIYRISLLMKDKSYRDIEKNLKKPENNNC